ncbi:MAG: hypothetical protein FJ318_08275 [SAR202 cluster bacterium]|nr:hypothetical protein [SAR202 cluster bacterium]
MRPIGKGYLDATYEQVTDRAESVTGTFDLVVAVDQMKAVRAALVHYFGTENWLAARDSKTTEMERPSTHDTQ